MSTYGQINVRAWNECRLLGVLLELTHLCNYDCFFCYNDRIERDTALSFEEYSELLQQLADMAVLNLTLTGGEPLVHPDFFAIGSRARELGFVIRIKSNGHLIRGDVAQRLVDEVAPYIIELSLHGASAATHDRQTRRAGSFDRLMENIDQMRKLGLRLKLNCTLTAWNEREIAAMSDIAESRGLPVSFNASVSPRDDGNTDPLRVAPTPAGLENMAQFLAARHADNQPDDLDAALQAGGGDPGLQVKRHCGAGSASVTIDQWGNVLPCVQWRRVVGNIRQEPFPDIWAKSNELELVQQITIEAKESAKQFEGPQKVAFFCPGMAELLTGDPLAIYPATPAEEDFETPIDDHASVKP